MIEVKVEDVGPCKKLLKVRVPQEDIQSRLEESYEQLRESVNVPGFRKGRVPRRLLERRFGEQVVEELKQAVLADASSKALEQAQLKAIGEPSFDSADFSTESDFTFDMTVEVEPEFELPEYKGLELQRPRLEIGEEQVAAGVASLLQRLATLEPVPGEPVQMEDVITFDWEILADGERVAGDEGDRARVHEGLLSGLGAVDLARRVTGARQGETVEAEVRFPEDYPVEALRGKEGKIRLTLKEVHRPRIPELTEEVARRLDFDSPEEVREAVRARLNARRAQMEREALEHQVEEALLQRASFDLPEGVLKRQSQRNLDRHQMRLRMRGASEDEIARRLDEMRTASETQAQRDFRLYFLLQRIADKEKIYVTDNEVENAVARLAAAYRVSVQKMRSDLEAADRLSDLRHQMRMDKVMDFLIANATVRDAAS